MAGETGSGGSGGADVSLLLVSTRLADAFGEVLEALQRTLAVRDELTEDIVLDESACVSQTAR